MVTPPVFPSPPIAFMGKYSFSYFITGVGSIYLTNDGTTLAWTTTPAEATALGLYSVPGSAPEAFVLQLPDPALQLAAGHALFLSLAGFQPAPNDSYPTATAGPLASATQLVMNPVYLNENLAPFTVPGAGGGH